MRETPFERRNQHASCRRARSRVARETSEKRAPREDGEAADAADRRRPPAELSRIEPRAATDLATDFAYARRGDENTADAAKIADRDGVAPKSDTTGRSITG